MREEGSNLMGDAFDEFNQQDSKKRERITKRLLNKFTSDNQEIDSEVLNKVAMETNKRISKEL